MDNNDSNIETQLSDGENVPLTKKKNPNLKNLFHHHKNKWRILKKRE